MLVKDIGLMMDLPLDSQVVKIGPERPKRNRKKAPHEDPTRLEKLSRRGRQMGCKTCHELAHNKRTCPQKNNLDLQ